MKKKHILQKIVLCEEHIDEACRYVGRTPKEEKQTEQLQLLEELKGVYGNYTKKLTVNDQRRLNGILKKKEDAPYRPVLEYMKAYEVKPEQEIIRYSAAFR